MMKFLMKKYDHCVFKNNVNEKLENKSRNIENSILQ